MFPAAWRVISTLRLPHSVDSLANLPIIIDVAKYFYKYNYLEGSFSPCDKPATLWKQGGCGKAGGMDEPKRGGWVL